MGVRSVNQHLQVFVSPAAAGVVVVGAVGDPIGDGLANGEVTYQAEGSFAGTAIPPTTGKYRVVYKDMNGIVFMSNTIDTALVISSKTATGSAEIMKKKTIPLGAPVVGDAYILKLRVPNYGGLISPQDEVFFYGNHTVVTGDDATAVAAALAVSLAAGVAKAPVPFVNITAAAGVITVEGIPQGYVQAKWDGRLVDFDVSIANPESAWAGSVVDTMGFVGQGTGKQVASMEEFYAGYGEGYKNRYGNWPYTTEPTLVADVNELYDAQTIIYNTDRKGASNASQRQTVIVFYQKV